MRGADAWITRCAQSLTRWKRACRLQEAEFLNDIIINVYLRYLEKELDDVARAKVKIFNSFFFSQFRKVMEQCGMGWGWEEGGLNTIGTLSRWTVRLRASQALDQERQPLQQGVCGCTHQ